MKRIALTAGCLLLFACGGVEPAPESGAGGMAAAAAKVCVCFCQMGDEALAADPAAAARAAEKPGYNPRDDRGFYYEMQNAPSCADMNGLICQGYDAYNPGLLSTGTLSNCGEMVLPL